MSLAAGTFSAKRAHRRHLGFGVTFTVLVEVLDDLVDPLRQLIQALVVEIALGGLLGISAEHPQG